MAGDTLAERDSWSREPKRALRGFVWVDASAKTPTWQRCHSRRACLSDQARGRHRHAMAVEALVPPDAARVAIRIATRVATVYTNAPKRRREAILANLCTLLRSHNRTRDRAGLPVPRRRRPHGPRDARALGPEAHAARAVTQPPTHTNSRSRQSLHHPDRCREIGMAGSPPTMYRT